MAVRQRALRSVERDANLLGAEGQKISNKRCLLRLDPRAESSKVEELI